MTVEQTTAEVLQEREDFPFGKPRPYTPDHPNLLAEGLPRNRIEDIPVVSGLSKCMLVFVAILAALYGAHGLATDDLFLPGKYFLGKHYHGAAAWLIFGMIMSFSGSLIAVAFARYDGGQRRTTNIVLCKALLTILISLMLAGLTFGII